jgi:acetylornithine deacetylase
MMTRPLSNTELLKRLVGFDSTSRNSNLPIADFISNYLDRPGIDIVRNESPDGMKTNLVIQVGPTVGDRIGLTLSGHMDVVPATEDSWLSDPFSLTETDGKLVGRGAADMKGFLALTMNRAASLDPSRVRSPLVLIFTYDEELGTLGARHFAETWGDQDRLPCDTIIGEPTTLRAIRLHKGHLEFRITLSGTSAHSGYPHLGANAIEPAGRIIAALSNLRGEFEGELVPHAEFFPEVPFVALNVARITGGVAVNVVPDRCVLECGVRLLPGMAKEPVIERMQELVERAAGNTPYDLEVRGEAPPMLLPETAPVYQHLCSEVHQEETISASYATDAGWLQTLGLSCVIFGPGSIEVAHKPNEFMPIAELERADGMLERVIHRFCIAEA